MSDVTEPEDPARAETVAVTINVPTGLLAGYDAEVERGIYETREIALLHGLVESHRHHHGRYSTLRVDLRRPDDPRPDTPPDDDGVEDALAAAAGCSDGRAGCRRGLGRGRPLTRSWARRPPRGPRCQSGRWRRPDRMLPADRCDLRVESRLSASTRHAGSDGELGATRSRKPLGGRSERGDCATGLAGALWHRDRVNERCCRESRRFRRLAGATGNPRPAPPMKCGRALLARNLVSACFPRSAPRQLPARPFRDASARRLPRARPSSPACRCLAACSANRAILSGA
jgi:hypothetical protein